MSNSLNKLNHSSPARKKEILCIESDSDSCQMLTFFLSEADYDVTATEIAEEGLEIARGRGFDLILLDSRYSDGSGIEMCNDIRLFDAKTPILFYSSIATESETVAAISAGAQGYVIKPYLDQLLAVIEQMLSGTITTDHNLPNCISHQTQHRI